MRVLITGSRTWEGPQAEARIHLVLSACQGLAEALESPLTVVHGDCPTGADAVADRWARRRDEDGVLVDPHPANFKEHGPHAVEINNGLMVGEGADMCVAFWRDESPGTGDCLNKAQASGIPTFIIAWEDL